MYSLSVEKGKGVAESYTLFPGCELTIFDIEGKKYFLTVSKKQNAFEINYCLEGRAEFTMNDGCLQYIGKGDIFISTIENHSDTLEFPLGKFKAIVLYFDLNYFEKDQIKIFEDDSFDLNKFLQQFFKNDLCFFLPANESTMNFFAELPNISAERLKPYLKLKALELLLFLENIKPNKIKPPKIYNSEQINIVKNIEQFLKNNIDKRYTINELSKKFFISETSLKTLFKDIYGSPISIYINDYRIQKAKELLVTTNENISFIAKSVGYNSLSKFGVAFKKSTGLTASLYRKRYLS